MHLKDIHEMCIEIVYSTWASEPDFLYLQTAGSSSYSNRAWGEKRNKRDRHVDQGQWDIQVWNITNATPMGISKSNQSPAVVLVLSRNLPIWQLGPEL